MRRIIRLVFSPVALGLLAFALGGVLPGTLTASPLRLPTVGDTFEPELGLPATGVVAIGVSPEAPEEPEVWAEGQVGAAPAAAGSLSVAEAHVLLRHPSPNATSGGAWQVVPLVEKQGRQLRFSWTSAAVTAHGGVVLGGEDAEGERGIVTRDPGGSFEQAPAPGEAFASGESLPVVGQVAIEEPDGSTGVLLAPQHAGGSSPTSTPPSILHYDGKSWTREPIEGLQEQFKQGKLDSFEALALSCGGSAGAPAASSPGSCWLLAGADEGRRQELRLYHRVDEGASYEWVREQPPGLLSEANQEVTSSTPITALGSGAQMLTATAQGAWVDFQAKLGTAGPPSDDVTELIAAGTPGARVLGQWCYSASGPVAGCDSLDSMLPTRYRSFAWAGAAEEPGTRIITGLPNRAMLELAGGVFTETPGAGGKSGGVPGGAAFEPPREGVVEGWIADDVDPNEAADGEGQSQVIHVTTHPEEDQLREESVPFRRPLYAVAQAPGTSAGEPGAPAIAVGEQGEIARYTPGLGWRAEALYNAKGEALTATTLRGVAWPEADRAYAVGDDGTMWLWRAETGLWEPDPAAPLNFVDNLTGVAFSALEPELGYAVGKQGVILKHGKTWEQVPLPAELRQANFTSIAFAGNEAIASYRILQPLSGSHGTRDDMTETGGIAVEEDWNGPEAGMHWHVDAGVSELLARLPIQDRVISKVAALSDGGAVAAGPSVVIARDSASAAWHFSAQPLPETQNVSALAAYRDTSGAVRAIISLDLDENLGPRYFSGLALEDGPFRVDLPPLVGIEAAPPLLEPDPLDNSGYVLEETQSGWVDMEHDALPAPAGGEKPTDMPVRPDPVLALLVSSSGTQGLAVGGQTGNLEGRGLNPQEHSQNLAYQTAAALRFPASAASSNGAAVAPVTTKAGTANFAVSGQATCVQLCANFTHEDLGPEVWLGHALDSAGEIAEHSSGGLRAMLYTGSFGGEDVFSRVLANSSGQVSAYAAGIEGTGPGEQPGPAGSYSFISEAADGSGPVGVLVLNFSGAQLAAQEAWLESGLDAFAQGGTPAIVLGSDSLGFSLPEPASAGGQSVVQAPDGASLTRIMVADHASAYFFDYPGANVKTSLVYGSSSIPAYGTGTIGYVRPPNEAAEQAALGSSGFLLASVETSGRASSCQPLPASCNVVPVSAVVIPNIAQLALDATGGTLLRRSSDEVFDALARRPLAGVSVALGNGIELAGPDPYDQIPFNCTGNNCAFEVPTEYTFTSSNPDVGAFVAHEPGSVEANKVELNAKREPVPDEPRDASGELNPGVRFAENGEGQPLNERGEVVPTTPSGLFCAYNAGTTTISISTGGLTYSEPITVQSGSVEYPCGTVPLKNPPPRELPTKAAVSLPEPAPAGQPPSGPLLQSLAPPPPPLATVSHPHPRPATPPPPIPLITPSPFPRAAIVPPPPPPAAEPTPPSGTSQVVQTTSAREQEKREESAVEHSSNSSAASAYDPNEQSGVPSPWLALGLIVIAAAAGSGMRRGRRSQAGERPALAYARSRRRRL